MKKAIIIIVSLLVILGGTFAVLWIFTPVFNFLKPTEENFSAQAKKLFGAKEELSYEDYISSIKSIKGEKKSYTENFKMSMNVSLPSKVMSKNAQKMLNASSVELKQSYDKDSKVMSNNLALAYNNKEMLNLTTVVDGKKISVSSKDLYDKALTFDLDKFKDFCKKNNLPVSDEDLKQIEDVVGMLGANQDEGSANLMYDLMYLTEDEYNTINKNCGDILTKIVDKKKFSSKKNQKITVGGDEIKADADTLTLSGKDLYDAIVKLAETARDDDTLKDVLVKKINLLKNYMAKLNKNLASSVELEDIKKSDIEEIFNELIEEFAEAESIFDSLDGVVKITIYSDKKSKEPVRVDIAIADNEKDEGSVIFTEEIENNKKTYTIDLSKVIKKFMGGSAGIPASAKIVIVDEYETTDTSKKGTITASVKAAGMKQDLAVIEYENVNSKSEIKKNIKLKTNSESELKCEIKFEATGLDSDKQKMVFDVDIDVPYAGEEYKVAMKVESNIEAGKSDIQKLDSSNSVDVFSKSQDELTTIAKDIIKKAADTLPSKLANYGIKVTKQDILKLLPKEEVAPTTPEPVGTPVQPAA